MFCTSKYSNQRALKAFDLPCTSSEQTYSISVLIINTRWHSFMKVRDLPIGGIPPVYFNIIICHVANYTTLNGHIVLIK